MENVKYTFVRPASIAHEELLTQCRLTVHRNAMADLQAKFDAYKAASTKQIRGLHMLLTEKDDTVGALRSEVTTLRSAVDASNGQTAHVNYLNMTISELEDVLSKAYERQSDLEDSVAKRDAEITRLDAEVNEWKVKFEQKGRKKKTVKPKDMDDITLKSTFADLLSVINAKKTVVGNKRRRELFCPEVQELEMRRATFERELKSRRLIDTTSAPKRVGTFDTEGDHLDHLDCLERLIRSN